MLQAATESCRLPDYVNTAVCRTGAACAVLGAVLWTAALAATQTARHYCEEACELLPLSIPSEPMPLLSPPLPLRPSRLPGTSTTSGCSMSNAFAARCVALHI